MNHYIISEEQLGEIIDITEDMCIQDGWVKEVLPLAEKRMGVINIVRSHPYNPQAERELGDYCNIDLTEFTRGERESDEVRLCRGRECNYCGRYNELREIRQSKDGE